MGNEPINNTDAIIDWENYRICNTTATYSISFDGLTQYKTSDGTDGYGKGTILIFTDK